MKSASDSARVGAAGPSLIRSPLQLMTATRPAGRRCVSEAFTARRARPRAAARSELFPLAPCPECTGFP